MIGYNTAAQSNLTNHVSLYYVDGISFKQCVFNNGQSSSVYNTAKNIGILTDHAGFSVKCNCDATLQPGEACPSQYIHPSMFSNLSQGISLKGANKAIEISESIFNDNITGINMSSTRDVIIARNNFNIGGSSIVNIANNDKIGVHSTTSTGYQIEENKFSLSPSTLPNSMTFGIVMKASGEVYNEIYKNEFSSLNMGVNPLDQNREPNDPYIGLQILCNRFEEIQNFDISVGFDQQTAYIAGIASFQGLANNNGAAGNVFSENMPFEGNFRNPTLNPITYFYFDNGLPNNLQYPWEHTPFMVNPHPAIENSCPSKLFSYPIDQSTLNTLTNSFYSNRTDYFNLLYNYNQQIDGGSTSSLLIEIQNTWPQEAWDLRNELISISPFVSRDALLEASFTGILPDALLLEICLANPDATKSQDFIRILETEIPYPLPQYMTELIMSSWTGTTTRTILEKAMTVKYNQLSASFNVIMKNVKSQPNFNYYEAITWSLERGSLSDYYGIADIYVELGYIDSANYVLEDVNLIFELNDIQQGELNNYSSYLDFLNNLSAEGRTILQLDSSEILFLQDLCLYQYGSAVQQAKNALCIGTGICEPSYGIIDNSNEKSRITYNGKFSDNNSIAIQIMPNPATDEIIISWEKCNPNGINYLQIYNSIGQIVESIVIETENGNLIYDVRKYKNGIYTYELISENKKLSSGKIVVQH